MNFDYELVRENIDLKCIDHVLYRLDDLSEWVEGIFLLLCRKGFWLPSDYVVKGGVRRHLSVWVAFPQTPVLIIPSRFISLLPSYQELLYQREENLAINHEAF